MQTGENPFKRDVYIKSLHKGVFENINWCIVGNFHFPVLCVVIRVIIRVIVRHINIPNGEHPYQCDVCKYYSVVFGKHQYNHDVCRVSFIIKIIWIDISMYIMGSAHIPGTCVVRCLLTSSLNTHQHVLNGELPCT
jgi:hypothetical protein